MEKPSRITINGVEYNLITDEELGELFFKEKLENILEDVKKGTIKTISLAEARKKYDEKIQNRDI